MSSASVTGSVRGWSPSTANEEVDDFSFSHFHPVATAPSSLADSFPQAPLVHAPASNSRPPMHRHSHSLSLPLPRPPLTRHYRPSSHPSPTERRAQRKREGDPNWVPRPPNSFMIFRGEFSKKYALEHQNSEPVPEKHLSKRAGEAWALLSKEEQAHYQHLAEEARKEHARKYPNYRYKPRRRQSSTKGRRSSGGGPSRREQVESFMEKVGVKLDADPEPVILPNEEAVRSSSPVSYAPPPRVETPTKSLRRRRSYSLPLRAPPSKSTYFLQPTACVSTSGVDKRSRSVITRPSSLNLSSDYFGMPLTPFNDPSIDESVFQFSLFDSESTAPSSPNTSVFDFSFDESFMSISSVPSPKSCTSQISSSCPVLDAELSVSSLQSMSPIQCIAPAQSFHQPTPAAQDTVMSEDTHPLAHRRQRSNTTSAIPPSPMSAVTSSLSNWDGHVSDAYISNTTLPTFAHSASLPDLTTHYPSMAHHIMDPYTMRGHRQEFAPLPVVSETLLIPSGDIDMDLDRTPRVSDFPRDVQNTFTLAPSGISPQFHYPDFIVAEPEDLTNSNLKAYATALETLRITPSPYGTDTPQSIADQMYNCYINPNPTPSPM